MSEPLTEIISILRNKGIQLHPCSTEEVQRLEDFYQIQLPKVYRDFLLYMGHGAGPYMLGSDCFYPQLFNLKEGADALLAENHQPALPDNLFVFWMHQGYQFAFFYLNDSDNPEVYYYMEGEDGYRPVADSLSDYFYLMLQDSLLLD